MLLCVAVCSDGMRLRNSACNARNRDPLRLPRTQRQTSWPQRRSNTNRKPEAAHAHHHGRSRMSCHTRPRHLPHSQRRSGTDSRGSADMGTAAGTSPAPAAAEWPAHGCSSASTDCRLLAGGHRSSCSCVQVLHRVDGAHASGQSPAASSRVIAWRRARTAAMRCNGPGAHSGCTRCMSTPR